MANIAKLDILNKQIIGYNYSVIKFLRMIASKNVTILMNSEQDLQKYEKIERYIWPKIIAKE